MNAQTAFISKHPTLPYPTLPKAHAWFRPFPPGRIEDEADEMVSPLTAI